MRRKGSSVIGLVTLLAIGVGAFFYIAPGYIERDANQVTGSSATAGPRAIALHKTLTIADLHADTLLWQRDLRARAGRGHVDLTRLFGGNVALQIFSSVTKSPKGQNYDSNRADASDNITALAIAQLQPVKTWGSLLERSLWHAEKLRRVEAGANGHVRIIRSQADLARLLADRAAGKPVIGTMLSVEGLHDLEGQRANLARLYDAGFRMAGLTHFFDNELGGSMHGTAKAGLTPLGRQIVRDMEARGMIVDIAHASHQSVAEILAMAKRPVVSSHGGVQATCKVNRNLTDDEIRGVAKTGGVVGIGYWDAAVCDLSPASIARAIVHVRDLVGIDYVGLGSDFDGSTTTAFDTARLPLITQALIDRGLSDTEIAKVMGGNVMQLLAKGLPAR